MPSDNKGAKRRACGKYGKDVDASLVLFADTSGEDRNHFSVEASAATRRLTYDGSRGVRQFFSRHSCRLL